MSEIYFTVKEAKFYVDIIDTYKVTGQHEDVLFSSCREIIRLNEELTRLREQVRWREIGEEQPGEGEEIITIDDNLSANLICFFAKEKEHWIELGIRWMPLPQPPEEE